MRDSKDFWRAYHRVKSRQMTTESCCVCNRVLTDPVAIKKRKKLHGKSCDSSKTVLNGLLLEAFGLPVLAFKETNDPDALLCHSCDAQMTNLLKYLVKVKEIKEDILQKVSQLNKLQGASLPARVIGRKRSSVSRESNPIIRRRLQLPTSTTISDQQDASQPLPGEFVQDQNEIDVNESSVISEASNHESTMLMCSPQTPSRPTGHINNQNNFNQPLINDAASNHESPSLSVSIYNIICMF